MTPQDIINLAMKDSGVLGVGQTLLQADYDDAFSTLNMLLWQWNRKRWLVYRLQDISCPLQIGRGTYSCGPGGDLAITARPERLEAAFLRLQTTGLIAGADAPGVPIQVPVPGSPLVYAVPADGQITVTTSGTATLQILPAGGDTWQTLPGPTVGVALGDTFLMAFTGPTPSVVFTPNTAVVAQIDPAPVTQVVDYPIEVLQAREDFNNVRNKTVGALPTALYYDPAYPTGVVMLTTLPNQTQRAELHVTVKQPLTAFSSLTQDIALPPEYLTTIRYVLATRLRPMYQLPPDPQITALAVDALNTLRMANTQVPMLSMPARLPGTRRSRGAYVGGSASGGSAFTLDGSRLL